MSTVDLCRFFLCKNATFCFKGKKRVVLPGSQCGVVSCISCEHYGKFSRCQASDGEACKFMCKGIKLCKERG